MKIKIVVSSDFTHKVWDPRSHQFILEPVVHAEVEVVPEQDGQPEYCGYGDAIASPDDVRKLREFIGAARINTPREVEAVMTVGGTGLSVARAVLELLEWLESSADFVDGRSPYQVALAVCSQYNGMADVLWNDGPCDVMELIYDQMVGSHIEYVEKKIGRLLQRLKSQWKTTGCDGTCSECRCVDHTVPLVEPNGTATTAETDHDDDDLPF